MFYEKQNIFPSLDVCAEALAKNMAMDLLSLRKQVFIALSGGKTPRVILPKLASKVGIDWKRVTVILTDERWVPPSSLESNARVVQECFLSKGAKNCHFFGLWSKTKSREDVCTFTDINIKEAIQSLDIVYLGMGEDGHIASLFPARESHHFESSHSFCVLSTAKNSPKKRVSLSLSALLNARTIYLQFSGAKKYAVYLEALKTKPTSKLPVSLLLSSKHPDLNIYIAIK